MNTIRLDSTPSTTCTDTGSQVATDIAREVLGRLEAAWNAGDGPAFGAPYADDATFVTIRGELHRSRPAIAAGHGAIFSSIYAGSVNHMEVLDARFVADDVIVVISRNTLEAPTGPLAGVHAALSTSVLVRSAAGWLITTTHNTVEASR